tara:strand:- start:51199 stop:51528 length:330 start_codon:yes stop_codon:yes gene_type:complete
MSYNANAQQVTNNIIKKLQEVANTRDTYTIHIQDKTKQSYIRTDMASEYNYDAIIMQDYKDKKLYLIIYHEQKYTIFMTNINHDDFVVVDGNDTITEIINKILLGRIKL